MTTHVVQGRGVAATVDLGVGGRVVGLEAHGREWLAPSAAPAVGETAFVRPGMGGWDEAIPTVAACTLADGTALPDHGDAWRLRWRTEAADDERVVARVELESVPLVLERTIERTQAGLRWSYRATTASDRPVVFLWAAHPQFAAPPGTRIDLGGEARFTEEHPRRRPMGSPPAEGAIEGLTPGASLKLFTHSLGRAGVVHADGAALDLHWDPIAMPFLGLFWDRGEFGPTPIVAIEPTFAPTDAANRARALPRATPGSPVAWAFEVQAR